MIETKKLLMDFVEKYRKTIGYACLAWFVFTIIVSYLVFTHPLKSIDIFVRDLYFKVKLNFLMPNVLFSPKALLFNLESVKAIEKGFDNAKLIFYAYLLLPFVISFFSFFGGAFLFLKYQINMFRKKRKR